ncbi:hypothetical protein V6N13_037932 [Hibiscus sabdariffa]|uniref:Uncharacterized protein n=1 Tax=Hibiscus sabdariffa TaxID=183260 RepID=A0ABR2S491_9ROSI
MPMKQLLFLVAAALSHSKLCSLSRRIYYALTLQWPPSACDPVPPKQQCIKDIPERFTIHGLWPEHSDASPVYPEEAECHGIKYSPKQLDNFLKKKSFYTYLEEYWPNLYVDTTVIRNFGQLNGTSMGSVRISKPILFAISNVV